MTSGKAKPKTGMDGCGKCESPATAWKWLAKAQRRKERAFLCGFASNYFFHKIEHLAFFQKLLVGLMKCIKLIQFITDP